MATATPDPFAGIATPDPFATKNQAASTPAPSATPDPFASAIPQYAKPTAAPVVTPVTPRPTATPTQAPRPQATMVPSPPPSKTPDPFAPPTTAPTPNPSSGTRPDDNSKQFKGERMTPLDNLFAFGDIGFFEYSAMRRDAGAQSGDNVLTVNHMIAQGRFAELAQKYNLYTPAQLKFESDHGDHLAGWFLHQPFAAGTAQFFAELVNPVSYLEGEGLGKGLQLGGYGLKQIPAVARAVQGMSAAARPIAVHVMNAMSPFRNVVIAGGEAGKRWAQGLAQRAANAPAEAQREALAIFGGLSPQEQEDVVHLFQGHGFGTPGESNQARITPGAKHSQAAAEAMSRAAVKTTDPHRLGELENRARKLGELITSVSQKKNESEILDDQTTAARDRYFPMKGAYEPEAISENFKDTWLSGRGPQARRSFSKGTEEVESRYSTLAEAQHYARASKENPSLVKSPQLKKDFSVVVQVENWASSSMQRLDLEDALKRAPAALVAPLSPKLQAFVKAESFARNPEKLEDYLAKHPEDIPLDAAGKAMAPWSVAVGKYEELQGVSSPFLKNAMVSDALAGWMAKNRTRLYSDREIYLPKTNLLGQVLNVGLKAWDGLSEVQRKAILANPLVHPVFNLANNSAAAGLSYHETATIVTKSIINAMGGGKLLDTFMPRSAEYTQWVAEAQKAGALAEMKTGDTVRLAARYQDLNPLGKVQKAGDELNAWHNRVTFGAHGEQAFSVALYRKLMQTGKYDPETAGGLVREALGHYQNVGKDGVDAVASRALFFYPWLKGNLPFWVRQFTTTGKGYRMVAAPHQAARVNNALVGDPSESGKNGRPASDFSWITGNKKDGFKAHTPLLPQRMLTDATALVSGDPSTMVNRAFEIVRNRLRPGYAFTADAVITNLPTTPGASPIDPRNYDTTNDKRAPRAIQAQEFAENMVGELAPIPLMQNAVQQGLRRGVTVGEVLQEIGDRGIGDSSYLRINQQENKQLKSANEQFSLSASKLYKNQNLSDAEKQKRLMKFYVRYVKRVNKALAPKSEPSASESPAP